MSYSTEGSTGGPVAPSRVGRAKAAGVVMAG